MDERWLTTAEAARHVGYAATPEGLSAFRRWANRHGVSRGHVGRRSRWRRDWLDAVIAPFAAASPQAVPHGARMVPSVCATTALALVRPVRKKPRLG